MNYRPAIAADRAFILSGWSSSLRTTRDMSFIKMADWASVMRPVLEKTLDEASVIVAEGEVLCGFIATDPRPPRKLQRRRARRPVAPAFVDYVLYIYVAQPFRRAGIARTLFHVAGIDPMSRFSYACRTLASWECASQFPNAVYDPFRARFSKEDKDHDRTSIER